MSYRQLRQLSHNIINTKNLINEAEVELTNLTNEPYFSRTVINLRLIGLRIQLKNLENKLILLLN